MDSNYLKQLWDWTNAQDPTFSQRYTFDSWTSKLASDDNYRTQFHGWVSGIDPSFSKRRPIDVFTNLVSDPIKKKEDSALPWAQEATSSDTQEMGAPMPWESSQKTPSDELQDFGLELLQPEDKQKERVETWQAISSEPVPDYVLNPKPDTDIDLDYEDREVLNQISTIYAKELDPEKISAQVEEEFAEEGWIDGAQKWVRGKLLSSGSPMGVGVGLSLKTQKEKTMISIAAELEKRGIDPNSDLALQIAKQRRTEELTREYKDKAIKDYYANLIVADSGESGDVLSQSEVESGLAKIRNKYKEHEARYEKVVSDIENIENSVSPLLEKLKNNETLTNSERLYLGSAQMQYQSYVDELEKSFSNISKDSSKLAEFEKELDVYKRNYNAFANVAGKAGSFLVGVAGGIQSASGMILEAEKDALEAVFGVDLEGTILDTNIPLVAGSYLNKAKEKIESKIAKRGTLETVKNASDFLNWFGELAIEQAPQLAMTVATGGAGIAIMGASASGEKYLEVKDDDKYTNKQKYGAAVAVGLAEGISEAIDLNFTNKFLKPYLKPKRAIDATIKEVGKEAFEKHMKKTWKSWAENTLSGTGKILSAKNQEGMSEVIAQIGNNLSDMYILDKKDVGLLDGVKEAYASGAAIGGLVAAVPQAAKVLSPVISKFIRDPQKQLQKNLKKLNELQEAYEYATNQEDKEFIRKKIFNVQEENNKIITSAINGMKNLSAKDVKEGVEISESITKLKQKYDSIRKDPNLTKEQKKTIIDEIQSEYNSLVEKRNQILDKAYAVQEQTTSEVPLQPKAEFGEEVEKGIPQTEPQVTTEEGVQEEVTPTEDLTFEEATIDDDINYRGELVEKSKKNAPAESTVVRVAKDADGNIIAGEIQFEQNGETVTETIQLQEGKQQTLAPEQGTQTTIEGSRLRDNIKKAISKVFKKTDSRSFKNGKDMAAYAKKKYNREIGENEGARVFMKKDGSIEILVNEELADDTSFGHEVWHPLLLKAFGDDQAKFEKFRDSIDEALRSAGYTEIADKLKEFAEQYKENEFPHEEYLTQLGGELTSANIDPNDLKPKQKTLLDQIKKIINNIMVDLTGQPVFLKDATPQDILSFMSTMSNMMAQGEDISGFFADEAGRIIDGNDVTVDTTRAQKRKFENNEYEARQKVYNPKGGKAQGFTFIADRMGTGVWKGLNPKSKINIPLMGGIGYPMLKKLFGKAGWAVDGGAIMSSFINKIVKSKTGIGFPVIMSEYAHVSNLTFSKIFEAEMNWMVQNGEITEQEQLENVNNYISGALIGKKNLAPIMKLNKEGKLVDKNTNAPLRTFTIEENGTYTPKVYNSMSEVYKELEGTFAARASFMKVLIGEGLKDRYSKIKKYKFPDMVRVADEVSDQRLKDIPSGVSVSAIQFDQEKAKQFAEDISNNKKLSEKHSAEAVGVDRHISYEYVVEGESLGWLPGVIEMSEAEGVDQETKEWYDEQRKKYKEGEISEAQLRSNVTSKSRASMPEVILKTRAQKVQKVQSETNFVPVSFWVESLKGNVDYLDNVIEHILEARNILKSGKVPQRMTTKSYLITLASMGSGGGYYQNWKAKTGKTVDDIFIEKQNGKEWLRPEGAAAAFLSTKEGKDLVEKIDNGTATKDEIKSIFDFVGTGRESSKAEYVVSTMQNDGLKSMTELFNKNKGEDFSELFAGAIKNLKGIGEGKTGFFNQYFGVSSRGVVDARQMNAWVAGQMKLTDEQKLLKKKIESSPKLQAELLSKIEEVGIELGYPEDLAAYIAHHAIWDGIAKNITRHEGEYVVTRAQKTRKEANEDFGIEDGAAMYETRAQKANPKEVRILSKSLLEKLNDSELEKTKTLINRVTKTPTKKIKAYKLFKVKKGYPGELFPLFVGADESVTVGEWIEAKAGELTQTKTGKTMVKSTLGPLAYRPGWHSGDSPMATHIGSKAKKSDKKPTYRSDYHVWAEVEVGNDFDWQKVATERAETTKDGRIKVATAHITDQIPLGGFYRYKTNPNMTGNWIISGEMKVNRVLTDEEVKSINKKLGSEDLPRLSPFDYDAYGFDEDGSVKNPNKVIANQIARAYIVAKETGENPELVKSVEDGVKTRAQKRKVEATDRDFVLPFGKHKGKWLTETPPAYRNWLASQDWYDPKDYMLTKEEMEEKVKAESRAQKASTERMNKVVDGVIKKAKDRGGDKQRVYDAALGYLEGSKVYEQADDVTREQMVRDLRKKLGLKEKRVKPIFPKQKDKKITVSEKAALKDMIRKEARGARTAISAARVIAKLLKSELDVLFKKGYVNTRQVRAIINKALALNFFNDNHISKFVDYVEKVYNNAEYAEKLKAANSFKTKIKRATKNKDIQAETRDIAKRFLDIDPFYAENIDEYLKIAEEVYNSVSTTSARVVEGEVSVSFKKAMNYDRVVSYTNEALELQEKLKKDQLLNKNKDLLEAGVLSTDMTLQEIQEIIKSIEGKPDSDVSEDKRNMIRDFVNKYFESYKTIIEEIVKTQVDPFTGERIQLTKEQIDTVKKFLEVDLSKLSLKDMYRVVESIDNFMTNQNTDGMIGSINSFKGANNAKLAKQKGFKARRLKTIWSKKFGRIWAKQIEQLPLLVNRIFGGEQSGLAWDKLSGMSELMSVKAKAIYKYNELIKNYSNKFEKIKDFNTLENIYERGILAYVSRSSQGTEIDIQNEFNKRKTNVRNSIEEMKRGTDEQKRQAEKAQEVYDKILADSNSAKEVSKKSSSTNRLAVSYWQAAFSDIFDDMQRVSRGVYNTILERDLRYTPDKYVRTERSTESEDKPFDSTSSFFGINQGFDTKESGGMMIATKPEISSDNPGRIVSLNFDSNMASAMYSALIDMETAPIIRQIESFYNSKEVREIVDKDDLSLLIERVKQYIRATKKKEFSNEDDLSKLARGMNKVAAIAASRALGGIFQPIKQTVPVAFNTLINSGGRLPIQEVSKSINFINNSGYPIAMRGLESQADIKSQNRILKEAEESKGAKALEKISKLNEWWLENFLVKSDVWIARASWIAYYQQSLASQGLESKNIDWDTHKINKEAADYAQRKVDKQQNYSDADLAGMFINSKNPNISILRKTLFPFATFMLNKRSALIGDLSTLSNKNSSKEDRKAAILSLSANGLESAMFSGISYYLGTMFLTYIANLFTGDDEKDEEREMKSKMFRVKGMINEFLSPVPGITDEPIDSGINALLEMIGIDEKYSLPEGKDENFYTKIGMANIPYEKGKMAYQISELAAEGKITKTVRGQEVEIQISKEDRQKLQILAATYGMYAIGAAPVEVASVATKSYYKILNKYKSKKVSLGSKPKQMNLGSKFNKLKPIKF